MTMSEMFIADVVQCRSRLQLVIGKPVIFRLCDLPAKGAGLPMQQVSDWLEQSRATWFRKAGRPTMRCRLSNRLVGPSTDRGRLAELSFLQRLDHTADKIAPRHDFQSPSIDAYLGCIVSTLLCQEPRMFLPIRRRHNLDVLKFPLSQKRPCAIRHWQILRSNGGSWDVAGTICFVRRGRAVRDKFAGAQPKFRRKNISRLIV